MSQAAFREIAGQWLATAKHPRFQRLYTQLVYRPMIEVLHYLRANGFKTYIVSGLGQYFMRIYTQRVYGIPSEQVLGSSVVTKSQIENGGLPDTTVGTFDQSLMDEANSRDWTVISMKNDWQRIFSFD
jgi:haloacid dehalogenase-like hydrolase